MNSRGNTANLRPPWKPGESGNPNGRPKKSQEIVDKAQDHADAAMDVLITLLNSDSDKVRLQAALGLLDRVVGKPKQTVENTSKKEPSDYSTDELLQIARMGRAGASETDERQDQPHIVQ